MSAFMKRNYREISIRPTFTDRILESAVVILLVILWGATVWCWHILPGEIPVHFDLAGRPNGYGSKATLFLITGLATFAAILTGISAYFPRMINLPVAVRTPRQFALLCRMVRIVNLLLVLLFFSILVNMATSGLGAHSMLAGCLDLVFVVSILGVMLFYSWLIHRARPD